MGLSSSNIGSFLTKLLQKGDPQAALAAGKGPVTAEWASTHGYRQLRTPGIALTTESIKIAGEAAGLYSLYDKHGEQKKREKKVKKDTEKKKIAAEEHKRMSRLLRRPSRERGIL
jgi:hypothetical protein